MNVDQALELAHTAARRYGTSHCSDPYCETCAARVLAGELKRLREQRKPSRTNCPHCESVLVDGICGNCTG